MGQPPTDLRPKYQKIIDLFAQMRLPGSQPRACYQNLPDSDRLTYPMLTWDNYRILLNLFSADSSPFVMPSLKEKDKLDEYVTYQMASGRYSGKRGIVDWLLREKDGQYVGVLHLYNVSFELWDGKRFPCMVGYAIAEPFRRRGYAGEALRHLLNRLPTDFLLFEAQAEPLQANAPSRALLEKAGFTFRENFKNEWGLAALYQRQLVTVVPEVTVDELDELL